MGIEFDMFDALFCFVFCFLFFVFCFLFIVIYLFWFYLNGNLWFTGYKL